MFSSRLTNLRMHSRLALVVVSILFPAFGLAQSSAHFSMKRLSLASGAATMTSTSYTNSATASQVSPSGAASFCNVGSRTATGFWSVLGVVSVPIVLTARRSTTEPADVDLLWSGADPVFQLYRAFTPEDVLSPVNFELETPLCTATDTSALQSDRIFYNVTPKP